MVLTVGKSLGRMPAAVLDLHVVIASWPGQEHNAQHIESQVGPHVRRVSVVHSLTGPSEFVIPEHWVVMGDGAYYGAKFAKSLELHDNGVMLQIQADAASTNWKALVTRCSWVHTQMPQVGIWTPEIRWSSLRLKRAYIRPSGVRGLSDIRFTDGIVWSLSQDVLKRLMKLNYSENSLGWGIELSAAAYCHSHDIRVVHDQTIRVKHPPGTSYPIGEASAQQQVFMTQLEPGEQELARRLTKEYHQERAGFLRKAVGSGLLSLRRSLRKRGIIS
jgi:hypothetical protein